MKAISEWPEAQRLKKNLWDGVVLDEHYTLTVLTANAAKAVKLRSCVTGVTETALEVGIGPLGFGLIAFLPEISLRYGVDPLPLVSLDISADANKKSSTELRRYMAQLRAPVDYIQSYGEDLPFRSASLDRLYGSDVARKLASCGFKIRKIYGHTFVSNLIGHARDSTFLGIK